MNDFAFKDRFLTLSKAQTISPRFLTFRIGSKRQRISIQSPTTFKSLAIACCVILGLSFSSFSQTYLDHFKSVLLTPYFHSVEIVKDYARPLYDFFSFQQTLSKEVAILRQQNENLLKWQQIAYDQIDLNSKLAQDLNLPLLHQYSFTTLPVIGKLTSFSAHSLIIQHDGGLTKNQAVISQGSLIGRVVQVSPRTAKIMLITDPSSRLPVMIERASVQGILYGSSEGNLCLKHLKYSRLATDHKIIEGDRVMSSGHGGIYPANIPVGIVKQVSDTTITIEPLVNLGFLRFVQALDSINEEKE